MIVCMSDDKLLANELNEALRAVVRVLANHNVYGHVHVELPERAHTALLAMHCCGYPATPDVDTVACSLSPGVTLTLHPPRR